MRVFKHLIALADIAVGFLGLFFIIFAVTKPGSVQSGDLESQEAEIRALRDKLRHLEDIQLSQSNTGNSLEEDDAARITIGKSLIWVEVGEDKSKFDNFAGFARAAADFDWPQVVVLMVDREVAFDNVVQVIDRLKMIRKKLTVRIATAAG